MWPDAKNNLGDEDDEGRICRHYVFQPKHWIDVIAWNGVINSYCALCCEEKRGQNRAEDANSVFMCCVVISYVMLLFMHVVNVMFTTLLLRTFSWYKQQMPELTLGLYLLLVRTDFSNWWSSLYTIFFKFTHSKVIL